MVEQAQHWLVNIVRRAEIPGADLLSLPAALDGAEAWQRAAAALGITPEQLATRVAAHFRVAVAALGEANPAAVRLVPDTLAERHQVFPLRADDRSIVVATSNPNDWDAEQALQFATSRRVVFEVAPPASVRQQITRVYAPERSVDELLSRVDAELAEGVHFVTDSRPAALGHEDLDAAPIVKLTNLVLREAIARGASDIHIEPGSEQGEVRFRVDGVLRRFTSIPLPAMRRVVSRIKILADLDISDRLRPQDGSARVELRGRPYDLRVSTVPMRDAEKLVLRILVPNGVQRLDDLGILAPELKRLRALLGNHAGVVVVTGPTGSGKTTTLYACLMELATGETNITSVEDPVEIQVPGISQIQVDARQGVTFASALRAVLRQDPDIIFIGEIRDRETAEIAVQASLTGHLVLATIHANDAAGVVGRLGKLGLPAANIADAFRGAISQRLVRRVCPECVQRVGDELTAEEARLAELHGVRPVVRAVGCSACEGSGYRGRIPVQEVLVASRQLLSQVAAGAASVELEATAVASGMRPIVEVARERVARGETTLQEVERVLGSTEEAVEPAATAAPHVLWVDDDPENRMFGRLVLEHEGFVVSEAEDGVAALEALERGERFQAVVLDLHMPRKNGREVLRQLRRSLATSRLPVIVLTASTSPEAEMELLQEGADDYLRKPMDPDRLVARLRAVLRRASV